MSCERWTVCAWFAACLTVSSGCELSNDKTVGDGGSVLGKDASSKADLDASTGAPDAARSDAATQGTGDAQFDAATADASGEGAADASPNVDAETEGSDARCSSEAWDAAASDDDASWETDDGGHVAPLEIAGRWHSSFGGTEVFDAQGYTSWGALSQIAYYDNDQNYLITQNPSDAFYSPNKFNKVVWTEIAAGAFYYCFVDFALDTASDARNSTAAADASDPATSGCGGFSWTRLSPVIAVEGGWTHGATPVAIDSDAWGAQTVVSYTTSSAITQNPNTGADAMKFNKIVWTKPHAGSFYFCAVSSAQATASGAASHAGTATSCDLVTGCLGKPWSKLDAL